MVPSEDFDFSQLERELAHAESSAAAHLAGQLAKTAKIIGALCAVNGGSIEVDFGIMQALDGAELRYDLDEDGHVLTVHLIEASS